LSKPCPICGPHRSYAFAPFDYDGTEEIEVLVKHKSNQTTLSAFTQWLLYFEQEMAKEMQLLSPPFSPGAWSVFSQKVQAVLQVGGA
jgi:hypothetical protein